MVNVPPVSGFIPDAIGASQRFIFTGWVGRASGMPPGPSGQPPAPVPAVPADVLLLQAARMPEMLESDSAAPPDRRRNSRRVPPTRRSFGCIKAPHPDCLARQPPRARDCNELGGPVKDDL